MISACHVTAGERPRAGTNRTRYYQKVGICYQGRRILGNEVMDKSPADVARGGLRDLARLNRFFGGHLVLRELLTRVAVRNDQFSLLDVGAGSGDMGRMVRRLYPKATVVSLDQQPHHLDEAQSPRLAADAFHLPIREQSFDYVFSSLFLHHFTDHEVVELLQKFRAVARRAVLAIDLYRHPVAYYFMPVSRALLGWNDVTVHDGKLSVQSAFQREELAHLASTAGLERAEVRRHYPWFRLSLLAPV